MFKTRMPLEDDKQRTPDSQRFKDSRESLDPQRSPARYARQKSGLASHVHNASQ